MSAEEYSGVWKNTGVLREVAAGCAEVCGGVRRGVCRRQECVEKDGSA